MICHQLNLIILFWEFFHFSGIVSEKTCPLNDLFKCLDGETCQQLKNTTSFGVCKCKNNFFRGVDGICIQGTGSDHPSLPSTQGVYPETPSVSAIVGGLLTAIFFVVIAALLVFAAKKYRWIHRVREKAQRFRERHYDTVLVNQEDDPPLA